MPAQQCRWCHHERAPAVARHEPTGRGQEDPVHGGQRRVPHPATQDRKLVMEHDDFQFLECVRLEAKNGQLQDTSNNEITERHEHEVSARMATSEPFYSSPLCSMLATSDTLPRPRSCATWINASQDSSGQTRYVQRRRAGAPRGRSGRLADAMSRKDTGRRTLFISNTGVLEGIFEAAGSGPCPR
jgi:hypothetical protein